MLPAGGETASRIIWDYSTTYAKDDFVTLVKSTSAVGPVEPRAEEPDPVKPTLKTSKKIKGKKLEKLHKKSA